MLKIILRFKLLPHKTFKNKIKWSNVKFEKVQDNKHIKFIIEESFLKFFLLNDHSTSGFFNTILENIKIHVLEVGKLRG